MSGRVSPVGIVRVIVALLHVSGRCYSSDEEEERHEEEPSLPEGHITLIPHLIVQLVDLLQSIDVVLPPRSVSQSPHPQIVHVSHVGPRVLEFWTRLQQLVLELSLLQVLGRSHRLLEVLQARLHVRQLVHL